MFKLLAACYVLTMSITCLAQAPTPEQRQNISNYFHQTGYNYLNFGHVTCDVKAVRVYFAAPEDNSPNFTVAIDYKDLLDQSFTCNYHFTWYNGVFVGTNWDCHSPDVKCFNACNNYRDLLIRLIHEYRRQHPDPNATTTTEEFQQMIANLFRERVEEITCSQYCFGFLILDYSRAL